MEANVYQIIILPSVLFSNFLFGVTEQQTLLRNQLNRKSVVALAVRPHHGVLVSVYNGVREQVRGRET